MQFNTRAARALQAGDHLTVDGAPGLRLVASTAGRAWIYRYKSPVDGRMRQVKLGEWPTMSAAQAGVEWERLRDQRQAGHDPAQERRELRRAPKPTPAPAEPTPGTVGALVDAYVAWASSSRQPKGAAELERTMRVGLPAKFKALAPAQVTRSVAYDLIWSLRDTPVQATSLRRELGAAWEWGHDSGRLADDVPNWWRQILRGKLSSKGKVVHGENIGVQKRVLSLAEVGAVIRHLPHLSRLNADLLTLYLWTGCRGAEIVQMEGAELAEVDDVLWWTIPRAKLKMGRHPLATDLSVPLVGRARDLVLARRDVHGSEHLFPTVGKAATPHVQQKVVGVAVWWHSAECKLRPEQARARWPIPAWAPHDLRRTVRTQLSRLGCPHELAEAILGHIDPDADVYDRHDYRAERLHWITRLSEAWESVGRR